MNIKEIFASVTDRFRDSTTLRTWPKSLKCSPHALQLLREEMLRDADDLGLTDTQIKTEQPTFGDIPVVVQTSWSGFRIEGSST